MPDLLPPLRVVVVEDESLVLFNLEDMLADLGSNVLGPAMRLEQALELALSVEAADAAIVDVNIGGKAIFPVAEVLAERGIPIIFATGYGREGLPPEWRGNPVLLKPYTAAEVEQALRQVTQVPAIA